MTKSYRHLFGPALVLSLSWAITPASAQVAPIVCFANTGVAPAVRSDGLSEQVGDYVLSCTGGTPTAAGSTVPPINLTIFLNTNITSKITAVGGDGTAYTEVLALVDEPNTAAWPSGRAVLNCGQTGAPDSGASGPGVCAIVSNGDSTKSYDGSQNSYGTAACDGASSRPSVNSYTCGRPNAFQGRIEPGGTVNEITFLGMPFDPPGVGTRIIRITNLRANAHLLGLGTPPAINQVMATASIVTLSPLTIGVSNAEQPVGSIQQGLIPGVCGTPAASTVRLCEGFSYAWKTKNLSFAVGDHLGTAGNATYSGFYTYSGTTHYPADIAQNVPGTNDFTESMFEWENSSPNGPPSPNPPLGFGGLPVANLGFPLGSAGYTATNTNPSVDGVATSGTRFALQFSGVPAGATIQVPLTVDLFPSGCSTCVASGVLQLIDADAAGGGAFVPAGSIVLGPGNLAVYEVLYANPFSYEYADVDYTVVGGSSAGIVVSRSFAPFYSTAAAGLASQGGFLPRFTSTAGGVSGLMGAISGMGLPNGTTTSLNAKLNAALADIAANNLAGACSSLIDLINETRAQSGKKLTVAQADAIISMATQLRGQLGC